MFKYFVLLLIFHLIGDFYFQTDKMAVNKKCLNKEMCVHAGIYILPYMLLLFLQKSASLFLIQILILAVSHLAIDCAFNKLKHTFPTNQLSLFAYDQILHISVLGLTAIKYYIQMELPLYLLGLIFTILLLLKPSGILINFLFIWIFGTDKPEGDRDRIGCRIGYFERLIIFLLCIFNSISTIGFILAAKTLVRHDDIRANTNKFREKYLIGTLASSILALLCFGILKYIFGD